ncbi:nck-associated protein 5-like isoform X2 [Coregonus clupeaformis]|uniref:nck-associated protein 5-like isoform X2 n=1 Tax=Coregonus clupeaformis TaxID=59861 RepID=UPI001E1C94E6|nr:nck-associated protein 5-like isoform X2 [Coregonus clupeaformis]
MRTMSDETEPRMCDENLESEEGDVEDYLEEEEGDVEDYLEEEENSGELMDRLRELEAENSALVLANESQREAYERCLDEVANHVVQALLNQKDLREECIKLKMHVFDLERQNRVLCELFQQKLPNQSSSHDQVQPGPLPVYNTQLLHNVSDKQVVSQSEAQAKGNGFHRTLPQAPATPPRGPAASMEALSPFFKKKAHILEVLRKMEETDPLKFHPSAGSITFCDYSQVLMSTEAVLAAGDLCKKHQTLCSCSDSNTQQQQHMNGEGQLCPTHLKKSTDSPVKCNHVCGSTAKLNLTPNHVKGISTTAAISECHIKSTSVEKQLTMNDHQQPAGPNSYLSVTVVDQTSPANQGPEAGLKTGQVQDTEEESCLKGKSDEDSSLFTSQLPVPGVKDNPQIAYCELETNGFLLSSNDSDNVLSDVVIPEKDSGPAEEGALSGRANVALSPIPSSCLSDVKAAAINSPSKILKFLKIPTMAERTQAGASPVRLSPQLTRTSKIPCRTNNYEVYHSPVPSRRAATTERTRQPPPPPARSESYQATTHSASAPTSPPQPEDACSPPAKELCYRSLSALKASNGVPDPLASGTSHTPRASLQKVPYYENMSELSTSAQVEESKVPENVNISSFSHTITESDRKQINSLLQKENVLSLQQQHLSPASDSSSSSSSSSSASDQDGNPESPVWHGHHSLPNPFALRAAQSQGSPAHYASMKDRGSQDQDTREATMQNSDLSQSQPPALPAKRHDPSSIPKRPSGVASPGRQPAESSHTFKDRLAALGKLRSSEDLQVNVLLPVDKPEPPSDESIVSFNDDGSKTAERPVDGNLEEQRHSKYTDSLDGKHKGIPGSVALKFPGACQSYDPAAKSLFGSSVGKAELEMLSSRVGVAKMDSPKGKLGLPSPNTDTPIVLRNNMKCPASLNLSYHGKQPAPSIPHSTSSPSKVPPKSPSKPCQGLAPSAGTGKPTLEAPALVPRYSSKSEDRSKLNTNKKRNTTVYGDSLPPPLPMPTSEPHQEEEKRHLDPIVPSPTLGPTSAIEEKVMKGIEENMLKLAEQDRGQVTEVKLKASNGIASWFGLKKSKLPALSRKPDTPPKVKDEKKGGEWRLNIPSKMAGSKSKGEGVGVESLNISMLMEKAEGLRRALEEERAYVNGVGGVGMDRSGRGHSCEVVMDQSQGQLAVMYRGARSDNFMQQLLNRVDGKDFSGISVAQRRLSFDCKTSRPFSSHTTTSGEDMQKGSEHLISNVPSDENLADPVHSHHFAASGASTYTLDSGIGTFPLPDYCGGTPGRSLSKVRGAGAEHCSSGSPGRAGRRARTLDREPSSMEQCYQPHREMTAPVMYGSVLEGKGMSRQTAGVIHEDKEAYGAHMLSPRSKTWTFPNLKTPAGSTEMYLAVEEEVETAPYGSPFRGKACGSSGSRNIDPSSLPVPAQTGLSRRGKIRSTPSAPEMGLGREAGLELVRERPEEALSPSRPQVLETPESLSDSLYDSLSSCGSQG